MKHLTLVFGGILIAFSSFSQSIKYEYLQVSTIESVVPGGLGRSRMITTDPSGNTQEITLENFFSMVGINFGNVRSNDKMIAEKINDLSNAGWELDKMVAGSYSADKSTGIFITRYVFKRPKK
jgi:hypothetical protein